MAKNTKRDWTKEIAEKFIARLEEGNIPWVKPWSDWKSWARKSGNDYKGINQLLLSGGEFVTFKQIVEAGGKLNKGSKGEKVIYYDEYNRKVETINESTGEIIEDVKRSRFVKAYTVFRVSDTDLETKHDKKQITHKWNAIEMADKVIGNYTVTNSIDVRHGSNKAFNSSRDNSVTLPMREQFKSAGAYYSTVFHELVHSTAMMAGRDVSEYGKSDKARAREELVAEIGAAYIMSYLGLESEDNFDNHAAYVENWAKVLKDDNAAVMYATPQAIKAADMILAGVESLASATPEETEVTEVTEVTGYTKEDIKTIEKTIKYTDNRSYGIKKVLETDKGYITTDGFKAYLLNEKLTEIDMTEGAPFNAEGLLKVFDHNDDKYQDITIDMADLEDYIKANKLTVRSAKPTPYVIETSDKRIGVNAVWLRDMLKLFKTNTVSAGTEIAPLYITSDKGKGVILPVRLPKVAA